MKLIDVLNKQCKGEIRKGTKLIIDFSYERDCPETYTYNGERFTNGSEYDCDCIENYGASTETLNAEVKLIEPPLYYLKMPNSKRILGILAKNRELVFESIATYQTWYPDATYLFTQDEIETLDILVPYRNFEWSEYHESLDS